MSRVREHETPTDPARGQEGQAAGPRGYFHRVNYFYMLKMSFRKAQKGVCMQSTCN